MKADSVSELDVMSGGCNINIRIVSLWNQNTETSQISDEGNMSISKLGPPQMVGERWSDRGLIDIKEICVSHHAGLIDAISMVYGGPDEDIIREHGEMNPRYNHSHIPFALNEFLTLIHGFYLLNKHGYPASLLSLGIDTNKNSYGPFGEGFSEAPEKLEPYSFDVGSKRFRGFHGAVFDNILVAIGVYVKKYISSSKNIEKSPPDPLTKKNSSSGFDETDS